MKPKKPVPKIKGKIKITALANKNRGPVGTWFIVKIGDRKLGVATRLKGGWSFFPNRGVPGTDGIEDLRKWLEEKYK